MKEENFKKFYENILLTDSQKKDAMRKYNGVCEVLHNHYYETKYSGNTKFLLGSYGKDTHIRPARDIDVIFKMPPELFEGYNDNKSNAQAQLLQDIRGILMKSYPNTEIKADGKVVTVTFSEGTHNIEILPAWENSDGTFCIPNSSGGGTWEPFDPKSGIKKITQSESKTGSTRFLIRAIKKWSENCTANVKSYEIEQKVLSFFDSLSFTNDVCESMLVRDFFRFTYDNEMDSRLKSHLNTAHNRANKALEFEEQGDMENMSMEWRKIFGNDFPKSEANKSKNTSDSSGPRPINPAVATPPYYLRDDSEKSSKYQLTQGDLTYIKHKYVQSLWSKVYFVLRNFGGVGKILERNYFYINLPFYREYEGESIKGSYYLKIDFNRMDNGLLPMVFDVGKRIQKVAKRNRLSLEDMHVYKNMTLCITFPGFIKEKKMKDGFNIQTFFEDVLEEVLYWHAYYEKYNREPWKALDHGDSGKREAVEKYKIGNRKHRRKILSKKK